MTGHFFSLTETQTCHTHMHTCIRKYHNIKTQNPELISWKYLLYKNTYGTIQSYTTSAHILRYQACDPKLEEDVVKPVSTPTINFRGKKTHISMVVIGHVFCLTNHRPVKTTTLCSTITSRCLSHTCTSKKPALFSSTHFHTAGRRHVNTHDTLCNCITNTYSTWSTGSLTWACCDYTCNTYTVHMRCGNSRAAVHTALLYRVAFTYL